MYYKNLCLAGLLRLAVQSFRLLRRDRLDQRNDTYTYTFDAAPWRFRTPLRPAAQGIQSNKVSMGSAEYIFLVADRYPQVRAQIRA